MYNPYLDFGEKFWGEKYFECINRVYKVGFYLGLKNARKMKNCILLSEHTVFFSVGTLYYYYFLFFFAIMHSDAPGLLAVPLINRFNQSSEKNVSLDYMA